MDERDHALAALKELEFDHRTGAIDDADYRAMVVPLRRAAADALRALDAYLPKDHPRAAAAGAASAARADRPAAGAGRGGQRTGGLAATSEKMKS